MPAILTSGHIADDLRDEALRSDVRKPIGKQSLLEQPAGGAAHAAGDPRRGERLTQRVT